MAGRGGRFGEGSRKRDRYERVHLLGRGGMGQVYLAKDCDTGEYVALKRLIGVSPEGVLRLKREFRTVADIRHPNLVKVYDLGQDDDGWFLAMEYVEGRDLRHVLPEMATLTVRGRHTSTSPSIGDPYERIVPVFYQVACGVRALHHAGILHRDLKPSNVIVGDERVVVLDFGLARAVHENDAQVTDEGALCGTPAYMAPEQAFDNSLSEASDWYAFGAMLYEALTGRLPFEGDHPLELIMRKREREPSAPHEFVPGISLELSRLCSGLLARDPDQRPRGAEVLARLAPERTLSGITSLLPPEPHRRSQGQTGSRIFGRELELMRLTHALEQAEAGRTLVLHVQGVSGAGKSALVEHFLDTIEARVGMRGAPGALVLRSRCYEREAMPFKALDSVMDALVRDLSRMTDVEVGHLLPTDVAVLAQLFPVLERIKAVRHLLPGSKLSPDALNSRSRAEAAFSDIFERLASRRPVVLWIDDLQWGDLDSASILKNWLEQLPDLGILVLFSYRSDEINTSLCLRHLLQTKPAAARLQTVQLTALAPDAVRALCHEALGDTGHEQPQVVEQLVREAQGSPFVALQLAALASAELTRGRTPLRAVSLEHVVERTNASLTNEARRLIQVLSVAGRPMPPTLALRAARVERAGSDVIHELGNLKLVRTRNVADERRLDVYHDRIRDAVLARLNGRQLQTVHAALLSVLRLEPGCEPDWLHAHALGAGARGEALTYGLAAAERAMAALAFARAAELYAQCLKLMPGAENYAALWRNLGAALVGCGRGGDAADAYLEAVKHASDQDMLPLMRLAASHLLRSGRFEEGEDLLLHVLEKRSLPVPRTDRGVMAAIVWERLRARWGGLDRKLRDEREASRKLLEQFDLFHCLRTDFVATDTLKTALVQARALRWALEAGEPTRLSLALCDAASVAATDGSRRASSRANELFERAMRLGATSSSPDVQVSLHMTRGWINWMLGRAAAAIEPFGEVERLYRLLPQDERGYYLRMGAMGLRVAALYQLGAYRRFLEEAERVLNEARATDNQSASLQLALSETLADDVRGVPDVSLARLEEQGRRVPRRRFGLLNAFYISAVAQAGCATGHYEWALRQFEAQWPRYLNAAVRRMAHVALLAHSYRINLRLSASFAAGSCRNLEQLVAADLKALEKLELPASAPSVLRYRARVALIQGDRRSGVAQLRQSADEYEKLGYLGDAARARYALGVFIAGEQGHELCIQSESYLRHEHVKNPLGFVRTMYPEAFPR
ncbi:MAG TPA: protein kinase [Polyangiaceae bacterium]